MTYSRYIGELMGAIVVVFVLVFGLALWLTSCAPTTPSLTLQSVKEVEAYQWEIDGCASEARDAGRVAAFDACVKRKGLGR